MQKLLLNIQMVSYPWINLKMRNTEITMRQRYRLLQYFNNCEKCIYHYCNCFQLILPHQFFLRKIQVCHEMQSIFSYLVSFHANCRNFCYGCGSGGSCRHVLLAVVNLVWEGKICKTAEIVMVPLLCGKI